MIYNITFDICAGVISALSMFIMVYKKGLQKESNRLLFVVIISAFISAVFDIWSSIGNSYVDRYTFFSRDILNYVFLFVHTSTACLFAWYMLVLLGLKYRINKLCRVIFILPEIFAVFMPLLLNPIFRWVFYYDDNAVYSHGVMIYVLYGAGYLYMLFTVFLVLKYGKLLLKSQRYAAILLLAFSIAPIFIQQFFLPHQLLELFFQSIGIFGFMTTVENLDMIYNPITKIYNRAEFLRSISLALGSKSDLTALIVKISRSDYFDIAAMGAGYIEAFMHSVAEWLNGISKKIDVYDCERGHFVLNVINRECDIAEITDKISERFSDKWQYQDKAMMFSIQICIADLTKYVWNTESFIRMADLAYIENNKKPVTITADEIIAAELKQSGSEARQDRFALEVLNMLDAFEERILELTPAECGVLRYYINGHEISEIPDLAFISINTVKKHNKNIYRKLEVGTKEELMLYIDMFRRSGRLDEIEKRLAETANR